MQYQDRATFSRAPAWGSYGNSKGHFGHLETLVLYKGWDKGVVVSFDQTPPKNVTLS